jgi:hypothetical protein
MPRLSWLLNEESLRGRITLTEQPPAPGRLGPVADALVATLAPGGTVAVLAGSVLGWLRLRRGDLTVEITRDEKGAHVRVSAKRVRELDHNGIGALDSTDDRADDRD